MKNQLILLLILFSSLGISAQNLSGSWGYKIDGKYITLYGDKIQNQNNGGTTGTLKVAIWATNYRYNGGTINGYKLGNVFNAICGKSLSPKATLLPGSHSRLPCLPK